jgi:hypothetical protein
MDVILSEKRSNQICFDRLFRERNIQTKVVLIDSEREKHSNQSYFDWFRARETFKPKLFWLIPSERNVETKIILIDYGWEKCSNQNFYDRFRARNLETQNCFEWFRARSVPTEFFCLIPSRNRSNPKRWLIASDRKIQSFLQRERVQKHYFLFPWLPFCPSVL